MIKCDNGVIHIEGAKHEILADISTIINTVYDMFSRNDSEAKTKADVMRAVEIGLLPAEEARKMAEEAIEELTKDMSGPLGDLLRSALKRKDRTE